MPNSFLLQYRGELAALSAALIWAIASLIYTHLGAKLPPLILNFVKSGIAIALILFTLLLRGDFQPDMSVLAIGLLGLSGAIGIGFGDTAFFASLNCLGARRALLLEALAPPLAAVFALIFLQEALSFTAWMGIVMTIAGVSWVVAERVPDEIRGNFRPLRGIGFGMIAALGQAGGAVLSRAALAGTEISPLWSSLIRLVAGVLVILPGVMTFPQVRMWVQPLRSPRMLAILTGASFFSTYLAIWLQQTALKFAPAGIAQALTATSPLFVIPIALIMGDRTSPRSFLGVLVALAGVWLLFLG